MITNEVHQTRFRVLSIRLARIKLVLSVYTVVTVTTMIGPIIAFRHLFSFTITVETTEREWYDKSKT